MVKQKTQKIRFSCPYCPDIFYIMTKEWFEHNLNSHGLHFTKWNQQVIEIENNPQCFGDIYHSEHKINDCHSCIKFNECETESWKDEPTKRQWKIQFGT